MNWCCCFVYLASSGAPIPYHGIPSFIAVNMIMAASSGGIVAVCIAVWAQVSVCVCVCVRERERAVIWSALHFFGGGVCPVINLRCACRQRAWMPMRLPMVCCPLLLPLLPAVHLSTFGEPASLEVWWSITFFSFFFVFEGERRVANFHMWQAAQLSQHLQLSMSDCLCDITVEYGPTIFFLVPNTSVTTAKETCILVGTLL